METSISVCSGHVGGYRTKISIFAFYHWKSQTARIPLSQVTLVLIHTIFILLLSLPLLTDSWQNVVFPAAKRLTLSMAGLPNILMVHLF